MTGRPQKALATVALAGGLLCSNPEAQAQCGVDDYVDIVEGRNREATEVIETLGRLAACQWQEGTTPPAFIAVNMSAFVYCPSYYLARAHHVLNDDTRFGRAWPNWNRGRCGTWLADQREGPTIATLTRYANDAELRLAAATAEGIRARAEAMCRATLGSLPAADPLRGDCERVLGLATIDAALPIAEIRSGQALCEGVVSGIGQKARELAQALATAWRETSTAAGARGEPASCLGAISDLDSLRRCLEGAILTSLHDKVTGDATRTLDDLARELGSAAERAALRSMAERADPIAVPAPHAATLSQYLAARSAAETAAAALVQPRTGEFATWNTYFESARSLIENREACEGFRARLSPIASAALGALRAEWTRRHDASRADCEALRQVGETRVRNLLSWSRLEPHCERIGADPERMDLPRLAEALRDPGGERLDLRQLVTDAATSLDENARQVAQGCATLQQQRDALAQRRAAVQPGVFGGKSMREKAESLDALSLAIQQCASGFCAPLGDTVAAAGTLLERLGSTGAALGELRERRERVRGFDRGAESCRSEAAARAVRDAQQSLVSVVDGARTSLDQAVAAVETERQRLLESIRGTRARLPEVEDVRLSSVAVLEERLAALEGALGGTSGDGGWPATPAVDPTSSAWSGFANRWSEVYRQRQALTDRARLPEIESRIAKACVAAVLLRVAQQMDVPRFEEAARLLDEGAACVSSDGDPAGTALQYFRAYTAWLRNGRTPGDSEVVGLLRGYPGGGTGYDPAFDRDYGQQLQAR